MILNHMYRIYLYIGFWGLQVLAFFSRATENEAVAVILILSILINLSYVHLNALKPCIYIGFSLF